MKMNQKLILTVIVGIAIVGLGTYFFEKNTRSTRNVPNTLVTQAVRPTATSSPIESKQYVPPNAVQPVKEWTSVANTPISLSEFSFSLPSGWHGSVYDKEGEGQYVLVYNDSSSFTINCPPDGKGLEAATVLSTQERTFVIGTITYTLSFEKWTAPSNEPWLFVWLMKKTMDDSPETICLAQGSTDPVVMSAMEEMYKTWK